MLLPDLVNKDDFIRVLPSGTLLQTLDLENFATAY